MKRLALIGYGYWGPNLLRNLFDTPECEVIYCCDNQQSRLDLAKKRYPSIKITQDIDVVLKDPDVEGVLIAIPTKFHFPVAKKALISGKHVLIEKPMVMSAKESEELVSLSKKEKKALMVDHTFLFNEAVLKIKELISKGELGEILYVDSVRANLGLFQSDVNVVFDLASHDFSIIQFLLETRPISISATGKAHFSNQEDVAYITIQYPNKVMSHVHVSWLSPLKVRRMMVIGTKKMVVYDDNDPAEKIKIYDKGIIKEVNSEIAKQIKINYRYGDAWSPNINFIEPLGLMIGEFIRAMDNPTGEIKSGGEFSLTIIEMLEAATKSIRSGGKVSL